MMNLTGTRIISATLSALFLLAGCAMDKSADTSSYKKFMGYIGKGDYSSAAAMEADDCDDDLGLQSMKKAESAYSESRFGKLSDSVKKCQSYELSKYIISRSDTRISTDGTSGTYTVSEKCRIMQTPSFSEIFSSSEYKKAVKDAKAKTKADSSKAVGNAVADIVYAQAKKQIDSASYKDGRIKVTVNKSGKITDVVLEQ